MSSANNFALYSDDQWYSFGNDYTSNDFNQFTNLTLDLVEYYVFSGNGQFRTWDNDNFKWVTDPTKQLNLTQAAQIMIINKSSVVLDLAPCNSRVLIKLILQMGISVNLELMSLPINHL